MVHIVVKLAGLIVGLVFGWVWISSSFQNAVVVALLGLIGYYVGAFLTGDLDLSQVLNRRNR